MIAFRPVTAEQAGAARGRPGVVCAAVLLSLLFAAAAAGPVSAARWYESYEDGERELRKGDAAAAARLFREALADRSQPGQRVRAYGMKFIDYYPHLRLGEALVELEEWEEARRELEAARRAGAAPASEISRLLSRVEKATAVAVPAETAVATEPPPEPEPPAAPTGLRSAPEGEGGGYRLQWNAVEGADAYEVQEIGAGAQWPAGGGQRVTGTSVVHGDRDRGTYRCRVRAVSGDAGPGSWSGELAVSVAVGAGELRAARGHVQSGRSLMQQGKFQEAAARFESAAGLVQDKAEWLALAGCCRATVHFLKGDAAERRRAIQLFRQAHAADPAYRLDRNVFSPKIIRLFEDARTGG